MSRNYPDGVTESMIPGFRPQDEEATRFAENVTDDDMREWVTDKELDCVGCVIYATVYGEPYGLETDAVPDLPDWPHRVVKAKDGRSWSVLFFDTEEDAIAYALCFHESQIIDAMVTEHLEEEPPEEDYDPF